MHPEFLIHMYLLLFECKTFLLSWLMITLDVKVPLQFDNTFRGGKSHAGKERARPIPSAVAHGT